MEEHEQEGGEGDGVDAGGGHTALLLAFLTV